MVLVDWAKQAQEPKVHDIRTMGKENDAEAKRLLEQAAKQVQPIMRKRGWVVPLLTEFYPPNPNLLGLNINGGGGRTQEIRVRLRRPRDPCSFYDYEHVLGTMLHELVHNVRGPHDNVFYKLLDEITTECEELMAKGISGSGQGFDGPSAGRLGSHSWIPTHNPDESKWRGLAAKAAEERAKRQRVMPTGPCKLGSGADGAGGSWRHLTPTEAAARAALRRAADNAWCPCERFAAGGFSVAAAEAEGQGQGQAQGEKEMVGPGSAAAAAGPGRSAPKPGPSAAPRAGAGTSMREPSPGPAPGLLPAPVPRQTGVGGAGAGPGVEGPGPTHTQRGYNQAGPGPASVPGVSATPRQPLQPQPQNRAASAAAAAAESRAAAAAAAAAACKAPGGVRGQAGRPEGGRVGHPPVGAVAGTGAPIGDAPARGSGLQPQQNQQQQGQQQKHEQQKQVGQGMHQQVDPRANAQQQQQAQAQPKQLFVIDLTADDEEEDVPAGFQSSAQGSGPASSRRRQDGGPSAAPVSAPPPVLDLTSEPAGAQVPNSHPPAAASAAAQVRPWACAVCTFLNEGAAAACEMCLSAR